MTDREAEEEAALQLYPSDFGVPTSSVICSELRRCLGPEPWTLGALRMEVDVDALRLEDEPRLGLGTPIAGFAEVLSKMSDSEPLGAGLSAEVARRLAANVALARIRLRAATHSFSDCDDVSTGDWVPTAEELEFLLLVIKHLGHHLYLQLIQRDQENQRHKTELDRLVDLADGREEEHLEALQNLEEENKGLRRQLQLSQDRHLELLDQHDDLRRELRAKEELRRQRSEESRHERHELGDSEQSSQSEESPGECPSALLAQLSDMEERHAEARRVELERLEQAGQELQLEVKQRLRLEMQLVRTKTLLNEVLPHLDAILPEGAYEPGHLSQLLEQLVRRSDEAPDQADAPAAKRRGSRAAKLKRLLRLPGRDSGARGARPPSPSPSPSGSPATSPRTSVCSSRSGTPVASPRPSPLAGRKRWQLRY